MTNTFLTPFLAPKITMSQIRTTKVLNGTKNLKRSYLVHKNTKVQL